MRATSIPGLVLSVVCLPLLALPQAKPDSPCRNSTVEDYSKELAPKARAFLSELQSAVRGGDKQKIADMVLYPATVNFANRHRAVRARAALLKDYDAIFTAKVRSAIEKQSPECLFANYQGVMIGDGEVWFEAQPDGTMKIKTVNVD
ncbi:MAG TPA: hypothetical protein VMB03_31960 [Bryobacteraceae bacterium]|nr:hypothetical protein [Bryobacteraceae bacterium]